MSYKTISTTHIFIDIVSYTHKRSVEAQFDIIQTLNQIVKKVIDKSIKKKSIKKNSIVYIPTGDGMCISIMKTGKKLDFQIEIALDILKRIEKYNKTIKDKMRKFKIRIGINQNTDNFHKDINGRQNFSGTGINMASRLEGLADESQILVGNSIFDKLHVREKYKKSFIPYVAIIKHNEELKLFQYINKKLTYLNNSIPSGLKDENDAVMHVIKAYHKDKKKRPNKNYIIMESHTISTLLQNKIEIITKKFKIKIMEDGDFIFQVEFDAPSDNDKLKAAKYKNTRNNNRFQETSYNYIAKSSYKSNGYPIKNKLYDIDDNYDKNGKKKKVTIPMSKWIRTEFTKKFSKVNEIIEIEFTVSHPFELKKKKDINAYFESSFTSPHAVRYFSFNIERYASNKSPYKKFAPVLWNSKGEKIVSKFTKGVYYKTYTWKILYNEDDSKIVKTTIN